jgi:hypothetical protein
MLTVAAVVGALMGVVGVRTRRARRRTLRRSPALEARLRVDRHRLVATRLGTCPAARPDFAVALMPRSGEAFRVVEDVWAHLDDQP